MKYIYSAWALKGEKIAHTIVAGEEPFKFADGSIDKDCEERLYIIEAETYEEAMAIYHLRQGWEPYLPIGKPEPCPSCGSTIYPGSSGECWKCHGKNKNA
ncbi:hypothetical protein AAEI00_19320 [Shewanella algae]|uniref:hypothetical protein n=1 Tax=Shewanella algae TaxID=38313 RepID=UPI003186B7B4